MALDRTSQASDASALVQGNQTDAESAWRTQLNGQLAGADYAEQAAMLAPPDGGPLAALKSLTDASGQTHPDFDWMGLGYLTLPPHEMQLLLTYAPRWIPTMWLDDGMTATHMVAAIRQRKALALSHQGGSARNPSTKAYFEPDPWYLTSDGGYWLVEGDVDKAYADTHGKGKTGVLFSGPPTATDVNQHNLADCWFMGALAALAQSDPDYIQNRLLVLHGTSVTCNLYWSPEVPVLTPITVAIDSLESQLPVEDGKPGYGSAGKDAQGRNVLWVAAIEKAMAMLVNEKRPGRGEGYEGLEVWSPKVAFACLTGQPAERLNRTAKDGDKELPDDGDLSELDLAIKLHRALNVDHNPTAACIPGHVMPVLAVTNGPTSKEESGKLADIELQWFNQNFPVNETAADPDDRNPKTKTGMAEIQAYFTGGFVFGSKAPSARP